MDQVHGEATSSTALPDSWGWADFDDTCKPLSDGGRKVPQRAYLRSGRYPVVDQGEELIGGFTDDESMLFQGIHRSSRSAITLEGSN